MKKGILSTAGNTPLVELTRLFAGQQFRLFAKLEQFNTGGSAKDRPAFRIIQRGIETGMIRPDTIVIESSSGNMGIGLAQACAYFKLQFICVVDPKITAQNMNLLKAFNADVDMVREPDPETGEFLPARIRRVKELVQLFENSFWPDQYSNPDNPAAHYCTMNEIATELQGKIDYLFCAVSTCGTLRGCAAYKRDHQLRTRIIAVDAAGSVIFGGFKGRRLIPGHGAAVVPALYAEQLADDSVRITDLESVIGCYRLVLEEAILAGGSSGAIVTAIDHYAERIGPGANCVAIFPDRGERYLDTIYSEEWTRKHFGDALYQWRTAAKTRTLAAATL